MPQTPLDFGIESNPGRYGQDGTGQLFNCYPEASKGKTPVTIYRDHGLTLFANEATIAGTRGLLTFDDALYWVGGRQLYKVDTVGTNTFIGGIADDGPVFMASNAKSPNPQIAITTKGGLKFVLEADVLTPISDADLPPPVSVTFLDGRMIYAIADGRMFYSDLNDAGSVNSLSFVTAEANNDKLRAAVAIARQLFAFGHSTIEVWQTVASGTSPIQRLRGAPIEIGCLSASTIKPFNNSVAWVDDRSKVRFMSGYVPQDISSNYITRLIEAEANPDNLIAETYWKQGHEFYVLSGTAFTVAYDASTGLWHDKKSSAMDRWRGQGSAFFQNKWVFGDNANGNLYNISSSAYNENGIDMVWEMDSKLIHSAPNRLQHNSLYLDFAMGQGLTSTDTHLSAPVVSVRYSDDGGFNYSNERTAALGPIGDRKRRVRMNRLGTSTVKGRTYKVSVSSPVPVAFMGAYADVEQVSA